MDLEKVPIKEQALVCGLFKQATSGDITFECELVSIYLINDL